MTLGVEHVPLPCLARCVDVAMCRFRIFVVSLFSSESAPPLLSDCIWRKAMGANSKYRRTL